jgi:hypothetical protein
MGSNLMKGAVGAFRLEKANFWFLIKKYVVVIFPGVTLYVYMFLLDPLHTLSRLQQ